jgi:hypothetical protein
MSDFLLNLARRASGLAPLAQLEPGPAVGPRDAAPLVAAPEPLAPVAMPAAPLLQRAPAAGPVSLPAPVLAVPGPFGPIVPTVPARDVAPGAPPAGPDAVASAPQPVRAPLAAPARESVEHAPAATPLAVDAAPIAGLESPAPAAVLPGAEPPVATRAERAASAPEPGPPPPTAELREAEHAAEHHGQWVSEEAPGAPPPLEPSPQSPAGRREAEIADERIERSVSEDVPAAAAPPVLSPARAAPSESEPIPRAVAEPNAPSSSDTSAAKATGARRAMEPEPRDASPLIERALAPEGVPATAAILPASEIATPPPLEPSRGGPRRVASAAVREVVAQASEAVARVTPTRAEPRGSESRPAVPRLIQPVVPGSPPVAPPRPDRVDAGTGRTVHVRIGTVEIRADAPPTSAPPRAPSQSALPAAVGFDEFVALRSHAAWTW